MNIQALLDGIAEKLEARGAVELTVAVDKVADQMADKPAPEPKAEKPEPEPKTEKPEPKKRFSSGQLVHWSGCDKCKDEPGAKSANPAEVTCKKCKEEMRQQGVKV